jgi:DNA-binding GntR family transcriptional regulator
MGGHLDGAKRTTHLSAEVFERLRDEIVRGMLRPNQRLVEAQIASRLEVSRTPVREALQWLTADDLVASGIGGWTVREHSSEEIREIYECRAGLEGYAAWLAAKRATAQDLQEIERLVQIDNGQSPVDAIAAINEPFHDAVIAAARNRHLIEQIKRNRLYYFNYRWARLYPAQDLIASHAHHEALARALHDRDAENAQRIAVDHIQHSLQLVLGKLG